MSEYKQVRSELAVAVYDGLRSFMQTTRGASRLGSAAKLSIEAQQVTLDAVVDGKPVRFRIAVELA